jgi:hypothetical protein
VLFSKDLNYANKYSDGLLLVWSIVEFASLRGQGISSKRQRTHSGNRRRSRAWYVCGAAISYSDCGHTIWSLVADPFCPAWALPCDSDSPRTGSCVSARAPNAKGDPPHLGAFFPRAILEKVRYSTDWGAAAEGTLEQVLLGTGAVEAVTFADVIVFRDAQCAGNPLLWTHELVHVEQYHRLGVEAFATQYLQHPWVIEQEAIAKADAIKGKLVR